MTGNMDERTAGDGVTRLAGEGRPKCLDLYCKAGGAGRGYQMAGFYVVGVDHEPQPRYAGDEFILADALEYLAGIIASGEVEDFDLIHASPPCQANSALKRLTRKDYIDLIPETRQLLIASGRPYVIENVVGAELIDPIMLCGTYFGLKVYRHRLFECSTFLLQPTHVPHRDRWGKKDEARKGISKNGFISVVGDGGFGCGPGGMDYARQAMGIDWMSRPELSQALPPVYTEWVGHQMLQAVQP